MSTYDRVASRNVVQHAAGFALGAFAAKTFRTPSADLISSVRNRLKDSHDLGFIAGMASIMIGEGC